MTLDAASDSPGSKVVNLRDQLANAPDAPESGPDPRAQGDGPGDRGSDPDDRGEDPGPGPDDRGDTAPPRGRPSRPRGEIFENSPVIPLGINLDESFYLDRLGQLRSIDNHTADKIRHVFGGDVRLLGMHFPQFDREGDPRPGKFDQNSAAAAMTQAATECGVWKPTGRVRGPGCWTDETGALVIHAGDAIWYDGKWQPPGVYEGRVYAAADPVPRPAKTATHGNPAAELVELIQSWQWRRPDVDPALTLGLICAQMLGGALDWRPVGWLTGDAATGKSTLQKLLLHIHGGEAGLLQAADATEAGIRSVVGFSSLPVAIDELEPDVDRPQKVKAVVELARRAASGAQIFRGSTDQKGYQSNAYSCFLFSSILVPPMPAQDRSRMIILDLNRIPAEAPPVKIDARRLKVIGQALRRSILEGWSDWQERLELWRAALAAHGQTGRGADNYGTVLALADMALHPDLPTAEILDGWASKLGRSITEESMEVGSNAEDMIMTLMGKYYDAYRRGEQWTVAQWVMAAAQMAGAPRSLFDPGHGVGEKDDRAREANEKLSKIGLRVKGKGNDAALFLPNKPIPALCEIFAGSQWADGVWAQAARRLPGAEAPLGALKLAGIQTRGHYVPLASIAGLSDFQHDAPQPVAASPHPIRPSDEEEFV